MLLLATFVAMQYTAEVNWSILDFVIMAILLTSMVYSIEFVLKNVKNLKKRLLICTGVLLLSLLVWAELAVGIIGSPLAGLLNTFT